MTTLSERTSMDMRVKLLKIKTSMTTVTGSQRSKKLQKIKILIRFYYVL